MAVAGAPHICPICGADAIDRVPRNGAVDHFVSLCGWRVYACCECRCHFYDWPSAARRYCSFVTGTLTYLALCMKFPTFELWRWGSRKKHEELKLTVRHSQGQRLVSEGAEGDGDEGRIDPGNGNGSAHVTSECPGVHGVAPNS